MNNDRNAPTGHKYAEQTFFRTTTGTRLHLRACPHLAVHEQVIHAATHAERDLPICLWSAGELDGTGRTYVDTLDEGLRLRGCHEGTHALIRRYLAGVEHDTIWLPYSHSYVALGHRGKAVAWVGIGYVELLDGTVHQLPAYRATTRSGGSRSDVQWGDICKKHFVAKPLAGECELCA